jgi:hypothetical protein
MPITSGGAEQENTAGIVGCRGRTGANLYRKRARIGKDADGWGYAAGLRRDKKSVLQSARFLLIIKEK